jgi:membrane fusion protein (multidrug efflux system)
MSSRLRIILLIAVAVIVLVGLTSPRLRGLFGSSGSDAGRAGDRRLAVEAVVVRPERMQDRIHATGTIIADEEVEIRSEISGKVVNILFREGSHVRRGNLLVKIDDSELQAQAFTLESQQKLAMDKENRRRQLLDKGNISPEDYDVTLNELNAIRGEVQLIKARIQKTELRAPFDGIIGLRYVSEGSYVSPQTRIASLQGTSSVKIDFSVPERYAGAVTPGQTIYFATAGAEGLATGTIYAVEPKIDPSTRTVLLRARAPNPEGRWAPGSFADVELILREVPDAVMIPTQALVPDIEGHKVYVARNGVAAESRVEIGLRTETKVQVVKGLQPADTVITTGILELVPGAPVRITELRSP